TIQNINQSTATRFARFTHNYQQLVDKIVHNMNNNIATVIIDFCAMADNINKVTCLVLSLESSDPDPMIVTAIDYVNSEKWDATESDHITGFYPNSIKTDPAVITEYNRLSTFYNNGLGNFIQRLS
ncbi:45307_t:CDS:2, partial [Gigaspora margarita]